MVRHARVDHLVFDFGQQLIFHTALGHAEWRYSEVEATVYCWLLLLEHGEFFVQRLQDNPELDLNSFLEAEGGWRIIIVYSEASTKVIR